MNISPFSRTEGKQKIALLINLLISNTHTHTNNMPPSTKHFSPVAVRWWTRSFLPCYWSYACTSSWTDLWNAIFPHSHLKLQLLRWWCKLVHRPSMLKLCLSLEFYCSNETPQQNSKLERKGFICLILLCCSPSLKGAKTDTQTQDDVHV